MAPTYLHAVTDTLADRTGQANAAPSPSNAQCSACGTTFSAVSNFDRHRRAGRCLDPAALGMLLNERGMWSMAMPAAARQRLRSVAS